MHMHLATFQVVGRTPFDAEAYEAAYGEPNGVPGGIDPTPFATGPMLPPAPEERGFKDTASASWDIGSGGAAPMVTSRGRTGALGRHSALFSSRRRPVFASSSALIGAAGHPFAFASVALTGPRIAPCLAPY